jgi:hypothetical protein
MIPPIEPAVKPLDIWGPRTPAARMSANAIFCGQVRSGMRH